MSTEAQSSAIEQRLLSLQEQVFALATPKELLKYQFAYFQSETVDITVPTENHEFIHGIRYQLRRPVGREVWMSPLIALREEVGSFLVKEGDDYQQSRRLVLHLAPLHPAYEHVAVSHLTKEQQKNPYLVRAGKYHVFGGLEQQESIPKDSQKSIQPRYTLGDEKVITGVVGENGTWPFPEGLTEVILGELSRFQEEISKKNRLSRRERRKRYLVMSHLRREVALQQDPESV